MLFDLVACAVAVRIVDEVGVEMDDAEVAARSRRAMELCTRGAGVIAEVLFWKCSFLISPLRRERSRKNTLAWTRTTRSGARSFFFDSVSCAMAVRVVGDIGVDVGDADAAARSRRIMERCTRGAEVVAKLFFRTCPFLFSPPRRERSR